MTQTMLEAELYEHIKRWIEGPQYAPVRDQGFRERLAMVAKTASLAWLEGAGSWMRPDLALAVVAKRKYDSVSQLSVTAFEVKTSVSSLTEPLFQALSYSRFADYCYLAAPSDARWTHEIRQLAERFGVGLIEFDDVTVWSTYRLTFAAQMSPDPNLREMFIDAAFPEKNDQARLQQMLHRQSA
ncbi:MAG: hypothetical protein ABL973_20475 [Micropepsaceae bacterium]